MRVILLFAVVVVPPSLLHVTAIDLHGVSTADIGFYSQSPFVCRNGDRVANVGVNDDFCDCPDGSDEPGTSACTTGKFYCANKGYIAKTIPSSMVNDRICDCCDGSDETGTSSKCLNTCVDMQVKASQGLRETLARAQQGLKVNLRMRSEAEAVRKEKQQELDAAKEELAAQEIVVSEALEKKNAAEEAENAERDRLKAKTGEGEKDGEDEDDDEDDEDGEVVDAGSEDEVDDAEAAERQTEEEEHEAFPYPPQYRPEDETEEGRELVNQQRFEVLNLIRPKVKLADYKKGDTWSVAKLTYEFKEELDVLFADVKDVKKFQDDAGAWDPVKLIPYLEQELDDVDDEDEGQEPKAPSKKDTWQSYKDPAAQEARTEYNDATRDKRDLETTIADIESFLTNDFGPNDDFIHLRDQCFDNLDGKYTYEFCPFGKAAQKEKKSSTNLGKFEKWEVNENTGTRSMMFTNGQGCWQGPKRSLTVVMVCGPENKVMSVAEPNKCTYVMDFETPHMCTEEVVADLQAELDALFAAK